MNNYSKQSLKYTKFKKNFSIRSPLSVSMNIKLFINKLILAPISLESNKLIDVSVLANKSYHPDPRFCIINEWQRSGSLTKLPSIDSIQLELLWLPDLTVFT